MRRRRRRNPLPWATEASGFLVGSSVFKTDEGATSSLAGSIPVRLRYVIDGPVLPPDQRHALPLISQKFSFTHCSIASLNASS